MGSGRAALVAVSIGCPECDERIDERATVNVPHSALVARIDLYESAAESSDKAATAMQAHLKSKHGWDTE